MAKLKLVVRGIRRLKGKDFNGKRRLPITPSILRDLRRWWERSPSFESALLWAVCCTAFFGFFRLGELLPTTARGDPALSIGDIAVDKHDSPSLVRIHLRSSKTDTLCRGVDVFLGVTCNELCLVSALVSYLAQRGSKEGPVFVREDGSPLLKSAFVQKLRSALNSIGLNESVYAGHSFRIGAATTAAERGFEDSLIKTLGRWESEAYQLYIRVPRNILLATSRRLVG